MRKIIIILSVLCCCVLGVFADEIKSETSILEGKTFKILEFEPKQPKDTLKPLPDIKEDIAKQKDTSVDNIKLIPTKFEMPSLEKKELEIDDKEEI